MKTILIDVSNLCYIAYHTFNTRLPTFSHFPIPIIYGVLSNILRIGNQFRTNRFIWACDSNESYRKQLSWNYKSNRSNNIEIRQQILYFTEVVLNDLGFENVVELCGYEADDILAGYAKQLSSCLIVSNDKDLYQCLSSKTKVYDPRMRRLITKSMFKHKYNILPNQWKLVKAIGGCSSDCVSGVSGVGEKTAIQYVSNKLNPKCAKHRTIVESKDIIRHSLKLVSLPFNKNISLPPLKKDKLTYAKFKKIFTKYKLKSFLNNIERWKSFVRFH